MELKQLLQLEKILLFFFELLHLVLLLFAFLELRPQHLLVTLVRVKQLELIFQVFLLDPLEVLLHIEGLSHKFHFLSAFVHIVKLNQIKE